MDSFEFISPTKFILEKDAQKRCGNEVKRFSKNVLLVDYGGIKPYEAKLHSDVMQSLKDEGIEVYEIGGVEPNPKLSLVRKGIKICRDNNIGCVLAVGGGSVIDTAKAIAIGVKYEGDIWDFYSQKAAPQDALPIGTVMTLPGTGSEGSNGSVIINDETGQSADVMSDLLRPSFTLMNPELTVTLPKEQSVYGIIDMFTHVLERYFSSSKDAVLTDHLCEAVMKSVIQNSKSFLEDASDINMRSEFMWTAVIAHNGLLATGRSQDWSTHMMVAPISATYGSTHGATLAVMFPHWARYVYKNNVPRFVQFASRVFGEEVNYDHPEKTALEGIERMQDFFTSLNAPTSLSEIGVKDDSEFENMAKSATRFGPIGNIRALDAQDVVKIYRSAL